MTAFRTSLARTPSSYTPDQLSARQEAYEREMWERFNAVVVRLDDQSWPWEVRVAAEARNVRRFGKRRAR